jgi:hypothetical protein
MMSKNAEKPPVTTIARKKATRPHFHAYEASPEGDRELCVDSGLVTRDPSGAHWAG